VAVYGQVAVRFQVEKESRTMLLRKISTAVTAAVLCVALVPGLAFAKPPAHNPILERVCQDTSWCLQHKDCYESESNRRALIDWYIDNC